MNNTQGPQGTQHDRTKAGPVNGTPPPGKLFGGFDDLTKKLGNFGGLGDKMKAMTGPNITPERRQALETVRDMLEPDKMGGKDRTFNHGDKAAIANGMLKDTAGLKNEVSNELSGQPLKRVFANRGLNGKKGPIAKAARQKVNDQARSKIMNELGQGLDQAKVDRGTAKSADTTPRNLTFDEVRNFQQATETLKQMQNEVAQKLGMNVEFPNGLSQAAIQHTLDGKFGVPPGGKLVPVDK